MKQKRVRNKLTDTIEKRSAESKNRGGKEFYEKERNFC